MPALLGKAALAPPTTGSEVIRVVDGREATTCQTNVGIVERLRQPFMVLGIERVNERLRNGDSLFLSIYCQDSYLLS
jgi:hypothetical protein